MQIVIEISEDRYKQVCEEQWLPNRLYFEKAIANGTPLQPHGRLIDKDAVLEQMRNTFDMQELYLPIHLKELVIDELPTILEAWKGDSE